MSRTSRLFIPAAFLASLCVAGATTAGLPRSGTPASDSPFAPPSISETPPPPPPLELRGVAQQGQRTLVSIFDASTRLSQWLVVGDREDDIEVLSYDPATETAHVRLAGHSLALRLGNGRATKPMKLTVLVL